MDRDDTPLLPHGGYRKLRSYVVAEAVYDATVVFCRRFFADDRRMRDQMVQAARSGVRNISEGSGAAATSRKSEMLLTNVARASLRDELLPDYESFLIQNGLRVWQKDSREALAMRERLRHDRVKSLPPAPAGKVRLTGLAGLADFVGEAEPEIAANAMLCAINQAVYLLKRQIESQGRTFLEEGGFSEKMYRQRQERRYQGRRPGRSDGSDGSDKSDRSDGPRGVGLVVFCIVGVMLLEATADSAAKSHPPQRPLPAAVERDRTRERAYYVDPARGDDTSDGSIEKPWKTMQHGVRRLEPGETLYLREGIYHETVYLTQSGTVESPIVIAAYPGELPVLDGGLREFLESPGNSWEPAKGGVPDEYVSTKAYPDAADRRTPHQFLPGAWEPMWGLEDQRPLALGRFADSMVPLHGYRSVEDLRSTNELQPKSKNEGTVYCGPGLWFNRETSRIHIRLAHHKLPGLGDRAYRGETDPRKLPLVVAVGFGRDVLRINGIKHVRIEGLVLRGATGSPMIHVYGSEGIHLDHLTVYGGFPALLINASQQVRVTHSAFRGLAAPWSGRSHMKYRGTASYQIVLQNGQPYNEDIEMAHCEFTDDHDFAFLRYAKNLQFHHNFVDNFNDDGLECGAKLRWHTIYIHHNRIGACLGVLQQHEIDKDESPATHDLDSGVYIYRNIFDQRAGVYYGLPGEPDPSGAFLHHEGEILSDHGSPIYPVMRVYQNTFLRRAPVWRNYFLFGLGARGMGNTERDVFNNLLVQADSVPGAVVLGKQASALREGGNLLWGVREGPTTEINPLAKLRKSPLFQDSQQYYEAGWTTHDLFANPKFVKLADDPGVPADLRLSQGSPAIDAGVTVPDKWPDPLRGADQGKPDMGAVPFGTGTWGVGVDGRIPVFGGAH